MDVDPEDIRYIAYTGKAATVLRNKGCPGAMTAHKLLYHAQQLPNGRYSFRPRKVLDGDPRIIVVDEISMLRKREWDLLCTYKDIYIIACGDPGQLPPVPDDSGEEVDNHVLDHPHIFLDEIMRQAQDSEIIRFSMHVREGKPVYNFPCKNEQVMIFEQKDLTVPMMIWADQILCATNRYKHSLNEQMRSAMGYFGEPQIGDKVINLHNEWDLVSTQQNPLTNGIIGTIKTLEHQTWDYPFFIRKKNNQVVHVPVTCATIVGDDNEEFQNIVWDYTELNTGKPSLTREEEFIIRKRLKMPLPLHVNYGYAITVWKAQGSEWGKVLLFEETGWPKEPDMRRRYLYTGITRAVDKLVIII